MNKNRKFSIDEMIKLYHELNGNHFEISKVLGCSREYVRQKLSPLGLTATRKPHPTKINDAKEKFLLIKDLSKKEAKELLNTTDTKIDTLLKRADGKLQKHANLKYTNEFIIGVYNLANGSYSKMAEKLGIKQPNISRMMKNRGLINDYPSKGRQL